MQAFYCNEDSDVIEVGVDEAGRGPLFGRVYSGAVVLPKSNFDYSILKDSKKFTSKKKINEPNLIQEETNLSQTIGFRTKITYNKSGKGNIKIFYNNLEQYNFLINKLKS